MDNSLAVVITDYDGSTQTMRCIEALSRSRCRPDLIIVVAHGTSGDTEKLVSARYPDVSVINADSALWWTGATNVGIRVALQNHAQYLLLVNNDSFVTPDTICRLVSISETNPDSVIAAQQRELESKRWEDAGVATCLLLGYTTLRLPFRRHFYHNKNHITRARMIRGCRGVLIPRKVIEQVGLFDETNLPHYGADHDFYLRCREADIPLLIAEDTWVLIDHSRTSLAQRPELLAWHEFTLSLHHIRSHRNLFAMRALYRKHYPVRSLYLLGVALNIGRYVAIYLLRRTIFLLFRKPFTPTSSR